MAPAPQAAQPQTASRSQLAVAGGVAASLLALGIAEGGYSAEARAVLAILVWTTVLLGIALRLLPRSRPPDAALVAGALFALLALLTGASIAWASEDSAVVEELIRVGAYLGVFTLVVCAARDGEIRPWLTGLALGIAAIAAIALLSRLVPVLPGGDEEIAEVLPVAGGRLSFPIGYWNGLAALLALGAVLFTWLAAFASSPRGRVAATAALPMLALGIYLTSSRGGFLALGVGLVVLVGLGPRRVAIVASALLGAVGTFLAVEVASAQAALLDGETGSQANWEGFQLLVASVIVIALIGGTRAAIDDAVMRPRIPRIGRRLGVAIGGLLLAAAVVAWDPVERLEEFKRLPPPEAVGSGVFVTGDFDRLSGSGRWQLWTEAVDASATSPLYGLGAGAYESYWNQHATIDQAVTDAHSLYLELLAELGPGALFLLLAFLLLGPIRCLRDRSVFADSDAVAAAVALVATGAVSAGFDWTWELPGVFAPVVVASGLLTGAAFAPAALVYLQARPGRANGRSGSIRRTRLPRKATVAVTAIGIALGLLAVDSLLAERQINASQSASREGDLARAANKARGAIALRPWNSEARLQLALIQESANQLDAAEQSISEAIARSPEDWMLWVIRGRIAILDGRPTDAARAYVRGIELNRRGAAAIGLPEALTPPTPPEQPAGTPQPQTGPRLPSPAAPPGGGP